MPGSTVRHHRNAQQTRNRQGTGFVAVGTALQLRESPRRPASLVRRFGAAEGIRPPEVEHIILLALKPTGHQ
jgi:hypothetical protein